MRTTLLLPFTLTALVFFFTALNPSHAFAMATSFETHDNPLAPFTVNKQNNTWSGKQSAPMLLVTAPHGGEVLTPGSRTWITWESTGSAMDFVNIAYSTDDGVTSTVIAANVPNSGWYAWNVPNIYAAHAFVRVEATDLVDVRASDRSDTDFIINGTRPTAPSPVTGAQEEVTEVFPGDVVQSPSFDTLYAIDGDGTRRPFTLPGVLQTYDVADKEVVIVTDATLPTIPLGVPMLPKPGVALVQFPFARTVYAVEGSGSYAILRPLHSEAIASLMYGDDWKEYVWTLPESYRNFYHGGSEIVTVFDVDRSVLRRMDDVVSP